jgi:hypothetical protein
VQIGPERSCLGLADDESDVAYVRGLEWVFDDPDTFSGVFVVYKGSSFGPTDQHGGDHKHFMIFELRTNSAGKYFCISSDDNLSMFDAILIITVESSLETRRKSLSVALNMVWVSFMTIFTLKWLASLYSIRIFLVSTVSCLFSFGVALQDTSLRLRSMS